MAAGIGRAAALSVFPASPESMSESTLNYDFVAPSRIVFGWGRRREAGALARSLGRRAFVICGSRTLERSGEFGAVLDSVRQAGVEPLPVAAISHEPLVDDVDATVSHLRNLRAGAGDLLLAMGGGSAIDLAKAAGALVTNPQSDTVRDYLEGVGRGLKIIDPPLPLLAMPTTGGTGTEATKNAVISSLSPPFKKSLRSDQMVPRIVLVDPELSVSVPPETTAWTGMDAITQLIESYLSRRATGLTRNVARAGLDGAPAALRAAFHDGTCRPAREKLAQAAILSGMALANSGLGMAHGVAAALGVHCGVPHGLACAVMLPAALRANVESPAVRELFETVAGAFTGQAPASVPAALEGIAMLLDELKIPRQLSAIGVRREQIPVLVRDSRGNSMSGNPRELTDQELTTILEQML